MDEAKALRIKPKPNLNGELKSISLINMTHPSLEETSYKINPRVPWTFMKNQPWSLKRNITLTSMEATS